MDTDTENELILPEEKVESSITELKYIPKRRYLEPAIFLLFLGYNLSSAVFTNEIVFQTCAVTLGYNVSECRQLGTPNASVEIQHLETKVQPYAATIKMVKSIVESLIPPFINLFFGNWSDKYGRKPIIISSFVGYFLIYFILAITSSIATIIPVNPWYYLVSSIPITITGGSCALITGVFAYITDVSTEKDRPVKMGLLEACIFIGLLVGSVSSSYILYVTNATTIFAISATCILLGLIYVTFLVDESVINTNTELEGTSKLRELFRFSLVTDLVKTCFKKRPNNDRAILWLTMLVLGISVSVVEGAIGVYFLFTREQFHWTIRDYSFFESTSITIQIFGTIFAMLFLIKYVKIPEVVLALVGFFSYIMDTSIAAVAYYSWHMYLAISVGALKSTASPMLRAVIAKVVPSNDVGKVFSLTTTIETLFPIFSALLYTYVYNRTLSFYPGAFNIVSASFYTICFVMVFTVFILLRRRSMSGSYNSLI